MESGSVNNSRSRRKLKKILVYGLPIGVFVVIAGLLILFWMIYTPVKSLCKEAQSEYGGDCVEALIATIESDSHTFKEKNHAIWAIGQLGDKNDDFENAKKKLLKKISD